MDDSDDSGQTVMPSAQTLFLSFPPPSTSSTATNTPLPSRSTSPLPSFYASNQSSSCPSDSDSEPTDSFQAREHSFRSSRHRQPWWSVSTARRRRNHGWRITRTIKRVLRKTIFHPYCANQPLTILLILILFSLLAIAITLLIMHLLNPDKEPLPWRAYCSVPSLVAPFDRPGPPQSPHVYPNVTHGQLMPTFPQPNFDSLPPVGLFVGVFSTDSAFERRQMMRTTWASHARSRNGAGVGDDGLGTSRTIVRFILGQPRKDWMYRVKLEMELNNDIIILPIPENMNNGKSYTFFSWSAIHAFVPPIMKPTDIPPPAFSYSNLTSAPPPLAPHDPLLAWADINSGKPKPWVRPDFVIKVDDDSFVMLAELEARLRAELHEWPSKKEAHDDPAAPDRGEKKQSTTTASSGIAKSGFGDSHWWPPSQKQLNNDPLIYWGYLVSSNRLNMFMAGELYALSWSLVDWISTDATVKTMMRGAEDKQTAKWMRIHPKASDIRWASERCWIYNHPRSGTVYSHGFLFPSEVRRVRTSMVAELEKGKNSDTSINGTPHTSNVVAGGSTPIAWAHSSVSTFGVRYNPPLPDLSTTHTVEALVEGSAMSQLREGSPISPEYAWRHREGRLVQYDNKRVGGTVVVHFIKKNMWYLETALAFLEGEDYSEMEKYERHRQEERERDRRKETEGGEEERDGQRDEEDKRQKALSDAEVVDNKSFLHSYSQQRRAYARLL